MANFNGNLILIDKGYKGKEEIPIEFMKAETYQATVFGQDVDSYRDTNLDLHRNASSNTKFKVEFETPPLHLEQVVYLMNLLQNNYIDRVEKKIALSFYVPETDTYKSGFFYVPDITFTMYMVDGLDILYSPIRIAFIEY